MNKVPAYPIIGLWNINDIASKVWKKIFKNLKIWINWTIKHNKYNYFVNYSLSSHPSFIFDDSLYTKWKKVSNINKNISI